jgi:transcriptional regulator with XRE-family HTH domain
VTIFQGDRVRAAREAKGLTQKQLAEAVGDLNRESVNRIENGTQKPLGETTARIARALDVPLDSLFEAPEVVA